MAELTERHIKETDIDWYCLVKGSPTHIASMGGMIPKSFRDREKLRTLQDAVAQIEPFAEIRLNLEGIQSQIEKGYEYLQDETIRRALEEVNAKNSGFMYLEGQALAIRLFASTFVEKARRGFRSFARREGADGNEYILIAEPATPVEYKPGVLQLAELECEIRDKSGSIVLSV